MNQLLLVAGCLITILALGQVQPAAEKVVFLDVGQGDAILLQAGTEQVLIDGGPDAAVLQRLGEELPWFDRNIDVVVATHPDKDHIGGLVHVLERYDVGLVLLPEVAHTSQLQNAWLEHIQGAINQPASSTNLADKSAGRRTQYRFAVAGQRLRVGDMAIEILHPRAEQAFGKKTNNASVSVRADFCPLLFAGGSLGQLGPSGIPRDPAEGWGSGTERGPRGAQRDRTRNSSCLSFLLTGDAESVIERQLAAAYGSQLDVDILKAGHHGSKTSTSEELLAVTSPQSVVISAGHDNQYGHPHPDVLERLQNYQVWRTDEQGSVRFLWHNQQWLASAHK